MSSPITDPPLDRAVPTPILARLLQDAGHKVIDPDTLAELRRADDAASTELKRLAERAEVGHGGDYRRHDERYCDLAGQAWGRLRQITA